jgi:predicted nucleotidyltransferase
MATRITAIQAPPSPLPGAAVHEGSTAGFDAIATALGDATRALEAGELPYLLIGGMASALLGRRRCSSDVDLLVMPEHALRALALLEADGFTTEQTNPHWLFKAFRDDVLVDILFKSKGDIYLDEEMLARSGRVDFQGIAVRVIAPEDLLVIKAVAHDEESPRHWHDALALLASEHDLDWGYILRRARKGRRRVLSLLVYATSLDLSVPREVIRQLFEESFEMCAQPRDGAERQP